MKKIVSALMISALAIGSLFAVDISIEYETAGNIYSEEKKKDSNGTTTSSTKTVLDQSGYDGASSDFIISASGDVGGFVLDIDPDADGQSLGLDEYYGWINFANIQVTSGKWTSRYVNRVKEDAGSWADADYERYKPGVVKGIIARDSSNLTGAIVNDDGEISVEQRLATAVAYTMRPDENTYFMVKGLLVDSNWGGFFENSDTKEYDNQSKSGFAGEVAFRKEGLVDLNFAFRSLQRDELGIGLFVSPLNFKSTELMLGLSGGFDLKDYGEDVDSNYREFAFDVRLRHVFSEKLALTTMNNISVYQNQKIKDGDDNSLTSMWNMVSLAYNVNEQLLAQLTLENECGLQAAKDGTTYKTGDLGGFNLSLIPGVTYSFNENASFTAGIKFEFTALASSDYEDANGSRTAFSIPFVFDVAL